MWNRMVENLPSVLEHFLAGCSSCFVEFSAALEALSFALDVACSALGIAYSARDARRVKLPFALGVAYLTKNSLSTIQACNCKMTDAVDSLILLPVVSLHEYTGLLKNNNKYSQKVLSQKTTV